MTDLAPIIIPAGSALAGALAATAASIYVGRERITQRIDLLSQSMERCKDDAVLRTKFSIALGVELNIFRELRYGEWRERLMQTSLGFAIFLFGLIILSATGYYDVPWPLYGWCFIIFGSLVMFTLPVRRKLKQFKDWRASRRAPAPSDTEDYVI